MTGCVDTVKVVDASNTPAVLKERAKQQAIELAINEGAVPESVQVTDTVS